MNSEAKKIAVPIAFVSYEGDVRDRVLRAKIDNCLEIGQELAADFVDHWQQFSERYANYTIMPMPSSMWGRLRGKLDLAEVFATSIAQRYGLKMVRPPWFSGWHLSKAAQVASHKRLSGAQRLFRTDSRRFTKICIIDDIVTTGSSYLALSQCLNADEIDLVCYAGTKKFLGRE